MRPMNVLTMILAGGIGERLYPMTGNRAKPAVPFGGSFKIIDFTLMNCVTSGLRRIHVLTQYHAQSLNRHCSERWNFLSSELGEFVELVPPKMRLPGSVYRGTADAIYRNLELLDRSRPDVVLVLSGDHIYRADYQKFIEAHAKREADVTVLTDLVSTEEASSFGVVTLKEDARIGGFVEKPADPSPYASNGRCLVNLGVYCFQTRFLVEALVADAKQKTAHDFGRNILPAMLERGLVLSCPLGVISPDQRPYWRDVGSIDSYFRASMDLLETVPEFELADPRWAPGSRFHEWMPARLTATARIGDRVIHGRNLVSSGAVIESTQVIKSIICPRARIGKACDVEECILFPDAEVGDGTRLRRVIVEEGVRVPAGLRIGFGDDASNFTTSAGGVVVIGGNRHFAERAARTEVSTAEPAPRIREMVTR
ncbi:MAG TPA: sugar phosphate nucleotidyltransferase [Planctomycetota bacterium]|nr:sugar phosphate nucleotidyltransferase [Planctomycetota bacterium]